MTEPLAILLSGMVAGVPDQGGAAWAVLQYFLGLEKLGHRVLLVEEIRPSTDWPEGIALNRTESARYFFELSRELGLKGRAALIKEGSTETVGMSYEELKRFSTSADVLINLSGSLRNETLIESIPRRVYVDLDPAFTQLWHLQGTDVGLEGHTHFVTVGKLIGSSICDVPTVGRDWIPTVPHAVLDRWMPVGRIVHEALTTVANWRGYGSVEHLGKSYGQKAHSLRMYLDLPRQTDERFMLALTIHSDEVRDLEALRQHGWGLIDPGTVARTPNDFRRFVSGSKAEFGIAKSGYVESRCGWFSDRSVCYLSAGRPVVAQDTQFSRYLPCGEGLLAFESPESAVSAVRSVTENYIKNSKAARDLAEEFFDSNRVLTELLDNVGNSSAGPKLAEHGSLN